MAPDQTHESLARFAVEEAYELADAIASGERDAVVDELGDVLFQVAFHARLGQEHERPFGIGEVADGIVAKLRRRHPHVFGDVDARTKEAGVDPGTALTNTLTTVEKNLLEPSGG